MIDGNQGPTGSSIAIVIPCYNEAERLDLAQVDQFLDAHPTARICFVDDKSTDATLSVLDAYCVHRPDSCSVIALDANAGKAEAVRRGMLAALETDTSLVAYWDADLAAPLSCVDELAQEFDTNPTVKAVLGSRVMMLGWDIQRKALRHYLGRIFATAVSILLGIPVYDTQCGAKAFRNDPMVRDAFRKPFVSRWIFDVEILARFIRSSGADRSDFGELVRERPLSVWRDVSGSKVKPKNYLEAAWDLVRIWRSELRS